MRVMIESAIAVGLFWFVSAELARGESMLAIGLFAWLLTLIVVETARFIWGLWIKGRAALARLAGSN